jgi:hypothetical protein
MENYNEEIKQFMNKVKQMEEGHDLDLSSDEDLSIAIMNLISMEEHFFFTYNKTQDDAYLNLLNEIREMRKELLKKIIKDYEGEVWCISKHLLATSMRLMEVGTKALTKGNQKEAKDLFKKSYELYSLFWGLNLGLVSAETAGELSGAGREQSKIDSDSETDTPKAEDKSLESGKNTAQTLLSKLGAVVKQAVDCCKE